MRRLFPLVLTLAAALPSRADDRPWNFAVQVSASVDPLHNQVTVRWTPPDPQALGGPTPRHVVFRKPVSELGNPDWGPGTPVSPGENAFTDTVPPGVAYEYKVTREYAGADPHLNGVGYVRTGIQLPLVEQRGVVLLVVESSVAGPLADDIARLADDLLGDGWRVVRIDGFSATASPVDLQARIRQEYARSGGAAQAVLLLGHLPVVWSGNATNPDGHLIRPMPADGFYADVSGNWGPGSLEGGHWVFQPNTYPAPLALAVGRVDFADLPAIYAVSPYSSEIALLRNYLAKDHAYRLAHRVPQRRALVGDAFGDYYFEGVVEPFAAEAYRNFAALFGDNVTVLDNFHGSSQAANWINALAEGSYTWAYGGGAGGDSGDAVAALGPDGVVSTDFVRRDAKADFYLMFGSFMVDWSRPNNLLRSTLASNEYGLACAWAGRPFLYFHSMGLGETIGYGFRLSQNGSGTLYDTPVSVRPSGNTYVRGVYLALLGDPTLRLDPVPPVTNLTTNPATGVATWTPPSGIAVREQRVYWLNPATGTFQLEATLGGSANSYTPAKLGRHMLRAVVLQTGSGTYFNASQGVFWDAQVASSPGTTPGNGDLVGPASVANPALPRANFGMPVLVPGR